MAVIWGVVVLCLVEVVVQAVLTSMILGGWIVRLGRFVVVTITSLRKQHSSTFQQPLIKETSKEHLKQQEPEQTQFVLMINLRTRRRVVVLFMRSLALIQINK